MVRSTLVELKYYPFMISLDKSTGSCNILSPKICVSKEIKDKLSKTMTKHILCYCKCKFNSTTCNSNQKKME